MVIEEADSFLFDFDSILLVVPLHLILFAKHLLIRLSSSLGS